MQLHYNLHHCLLVKCYLDEQHYDWKNASWQQHMPVGTYCVFHKALA